MLLLLIRNNNSKKKYIENTCENSDLGPQVSLTEASLEGIAKKVERVPGASSELLLLPGQ